MLFRCDICFGIFLVRICISGSRRSLNPKSIAEIIFVTVLMSFDSIFIRHPFFRCSNLRFELITLSLFMYDKLRAIIGII